MGVGFDPEAERDAERDEHVVVIRPPDEMLSTNAVLARLRSLVGGSLSHTDTVNCVYIWIEELEAGKPTL